MQLFPSVAGLLGEHVGHHLAWRLVGFLLRHIVKPVGVQQQAVAGLHVDGLLTEQGVGADPQRRARVVDHLALAVGTQQDQRRMARRGHRDLAGLHVQQAVRRGDEQARGAAFVTNVRVGAAEHDRRRDRPLRVGVRHADALLEQHGQHRGADAMAGRVRHVGHHVAIVDADNVVEVAADVAARAVDRVHREVAQRRRRERKQRPLDQLGPVEVLVDGLLLPAEQLAGFLELGDLLAELGVAGFEVAGELETFGGQSPLANGVSHADQQRFRRRQRLGDEVVDVQLDGLDRVGERGPAREDDERRGQLGVAGPGHQRQARPCAA